MFRYNKRNSTQPHISAIIVAAGEGTRMEGIDKQRVQIDEIPVVIRSIAAFEDCDRIREIVLVCQEELIPDYFALVQDYDLHKVSSVVGGGLTRQDSVARGIEACSNDSAFFAIHDGARPLVEQETINTCIDAALTCGAAAAGVPVKDTIKMRGEDGFVTSTPKRSQLIAIQTPQVFDAVLYRQALLKAQKAGRIYTDDCQLIEQLGKRVYISPGSYRNIKITTPEDLAIADALLRYQEEGAEVWGYQE